MPHEVAATLIDPELRAGHRQDVQYVFLAQLAQVRRIVPSRGILRHRHSGADGGLPDAVPASRVVTHRREHEPRLNRRRGLSSRGSRASCARVPSSASRPSRVVAIREYGIRERHHLRTGGATFASVIVDIPATVGLVSSSVSSRTSAGSWGRSAKCGAARRSRPRDIHPR